MFPITRRCTVLHPLTLASADVREALSDVSHLFSNGFLSNGVNWTSFPVRGPARRMGGDHKLVDQVRKRVQGLSEHIGVGVADTSIAAFLTAGHPRQVVIDPGNDQEFLSSVPLTVVAELGFVAPELVETLTALGYRTIDSISSVEQTLLRDRFGSAGVHLWHLSNGHEVMYTEFRESRDAVLREVAFEEPLQIAEQIVFGVRATVEELVASLVQESQLCTQFSLVLETDHAEVCERVWHFSSGFNARAMIERARWQLEEWLLSGSATAGVTLARFCVYATRPTNSEQLSLWGDHSATDTDAIRLVGKLSGTFGADSVCLARWRGGRDVNEIFTMVPGLDLDLLDVETTIRMQRPPHHEGPWRGLLPSPLPAVAFPIPEPVQIIDEVGRAVGVTRRCELTSIPCRLIRANSAALDVLTWAGPWPIEERWWAPEVAQRIVQMQVVLIDAEGAENPVLVQLQRAGWVIAAVYM
jgi:protein ImuB